MWMSADCCENGTTKSKTTRPLASAILYTLGHGYNQNDVNNGRMAVWQCITRRIWSL